MPCITKQIPGILKPMSGIDFTQRDEPVPPLHTGERLRYRGVSEELGDVQKLTCSIEMVDHEIDHMYPVLDVGAEAKAGPSDDRIVHIQQAAKIASDLVPERRSIRAADG